MSTVYGSSGWRGVAVLLIQSVLPPLAASSAERPAPTPIVQRLQGTWEGVVVGDKSETKYTIKIDGSSFYFHRDTNFWFETSIALPRNTNPQQLHATIKNCAKGQESSIGKVVVALVKVDGETLTLVAKGDGSEDLPQSLESTDDKGLTHYRLHRVTPPVRAPRG